MHTDRTDTIDPGSAAAEPRTREMKAGDLTAGMILRFTGAEPARVSRVRRDEDGIVLVTFDGFAAEVGYVAEWPVTVVGWDGAAAPLAAPGYMSCPRECGVDVREHASSGLIDGRCDTDYWLALAADLRAAADRIASLAGTPAPEVHASLSLRVGSVVEAGHEERRPVVDAIAAALGGTAADVQPSPTWWARQVTAKVGGLGVIVWTLLPAPEAPETVALRAEVAELRAQLAEGGAR
ncbi:hypothetical protein [Salinispora arenicola]|uniref:hypothetical protein n=1 Tax=Salinispora arenicola TaxID=168697 RepID=UPI000515742A|nr:hypothetical protein [Salinispora arenicola]